VVAGGRWEIRPLPGFIRACSTMGAFAGFAAMHPLPLAFLIVSVFSPSFRPQTKSKLQGPSIRKREIPVKSVSTLGIEKNLAILEKIR
jgi:hypothetical protein